MGNFVKVTENVVNTYPRFGGFTFCVLLQINTPNLIYRNFIQGNTAQTGVWPSLLQRSTKKDPK
jgi:hypothetical protein